MSSPGSHSTASSSDKGAMPEPRHIPSERPGPTGGKRDANRRAKTEALCRAGLELFLERGIEAVTIDELAKGAGVAKGSFYRYFKDKKDLVDALFEPMAQELVRAFDNADVALRKASQANLAGAYLALAQDLSRILSERRDFVRLYLQENRAPGVGAREPIARLSKHITLSAYRLTEIAHEANLLTTVNPRVTALSVVGATERLLYAYLTGEDVGENEASIAMALISMVLEGMRPRK